MTLPNHAEGALGSSPMGTGDESRASLPKQRPVGVSSLSMKGERIRYQQTGEFHFLTFMAVPESVYLAGAKEAAEKGS
jgi:hypothetical protein